MEYGLFDARQRWPNVCHVALELGLKPAVSANSGKAVTGSHSRQRVVAEAGLHHDYPASALCLPTSA
ncbi:MAG: hypothetical protein FJ194_07375 [Gammaproteobacteria bacterium]|nr:hypothetical protein [Gammaproteobacteria bacterium]